MRGDLVARPANGAPGKAALSALVPTPIHVEGIYYVSFTLFLRGDKFFSDSRPLSLIS